MLCDDLNGWDGSGVELEGVRGADIYVHTANSCIARN